MDIDKDFKLRNSEATYLDEREPTNRGVLAAINYYSYKTYKEKVKSLA